MTTPPAREINMDELRRGVPKVIAFGNPSSSQQKAEKKARHRAAARRKPAKQPIR